METRKLVICAIIAAVLALAGCASSPVEERKRQEMEADIDDILSYELDPAEYGETRNCLRDNSYRNYHALGNRHLLFRGRQGQLWVNVLRGRCFGLDRYSVFIMEPKHSGSLCAMDRFAVVDRIDSLSRADAGPSCVLGEFRPVTADQVEEIEKRLEMR